VDERYCIKNSIFSLKNLMDSRRWPIMEFNGEDIYVACGIFNLGIKFMD